MLFLFYVLMQLIKFGGCGTELSQSFEEHDRMTPKQLSHIHKERESGLDVTAKK